jgi:probable HAF family extracellular repeat protein
MKAFRSFLVILSFLLALALVEGATSAAAQSYLVIDLGTPGLTGSYSDPHGINRYGDVVGEWEPTNGPYQKAFLYANVTNTDIGSLQGAYALAHGINNSNLVVGESGNIDIRGFLYTNGSMTDLGTLGGTYSVAWALNDATEIVGESTISPLPDAPDHAIWWHGGTKTDLGVLPNGDYSSARGINNSNIIVGEASVILGPGITNIYAFIYTNGPIQSLGTLPGGDYSCARAINDSGQIVGEASLSNGDIQSFLYSGGVITNLGTFGGNYSTAAAINSSGRIVGYALTSGGDAHAFLYNGSTLLDLNTALSSPTVCTNLISADGINDAGQITGSGYTPNGDYHAFLLTPAQLVPPVLWLSAPTPLTNGQFSVTVNGTAGQHFVLQASPNFVNWLAVSTNTLATSSLDCIDASASSNHFTFYRAFSLP